MIEIRDLTKNFGEKRALDGLSMTVREGIAFGFLGRNGAGKTTTIRILMNIFREDAGTALIDGVPTRKEPKRIGYLPEERGLYAKRTVMEQIVYLANLKGFERKAAERAARDKLEELEATEYADKKLETLSKGNQQKIQLAVALLGDPEIVILDEPFSGLDPINAQILKTAVRRQADMGKTVIFSSHQMAQVEEFCDDICIIDRGRAVLEGNLAEIKRSYPRDRIFVAAGGDATGSDFAHVGGFGSASAVLGGNVQPRGGDLAGGFSTRAQSLSQHLEALSFVKAVERRGVGLAVTLSDASRRSDLLHALGETGADIDSFSVIEPTLEEIFVEKAGASPAEKTQTDGAGGGKAKRRGLAGLFGKGGAK